MRTLLTKLEVAALLGKSLKTVQRITPQLVTEQGSEKGRNGQRPLLYHLSSLPAADQQKWAEQQQAKVVQIARPAVDDPGQMTLALSTPAGPNLEPADRAEAELRYRVIEPLLKPDDHRGIWLQCENRRTAVVEYLATHHQTKPRTIYTWLTKFKDGGLPALVGRDRNDKGRPRSFNAAALDFIVAAALPKSGAYGKLTVREIYRAYKEERQWRAEHADKPLGDFERQKYARYLDGRAQLRPEAQLPAASYETFRTWFNKIPDVVKVMAREGGEAFSNTQEILSYRALSEINPLEYLVMDHRTLDLFCMVKRGGKWTLIRPWLTAAIDMRTRKWLGWAIVETPSSDSIATVLKRTFLNYGLPKACYWDNGKDFLCEWLEGNKRRNGQKFKVEQLSDGIRGVMETLGIRVHHAIVKRARSKIIEPCFIATANFDRTLPEWCGHRPTARPEQFGQMVKQFERWTKGEAKTTPFRTIEDIAALYNEFLLSLGEREHQGEGMRKVTPTGRGWMCPNEAWETLISRVDVRMAPPEVLQFCFHKRRALTVRNGELRPSFHGQQYHYRMVENPMALMALNGRDVEFAYDPNDLETGAVYCEGRFLGLVNNVELRRMGEDGFVVDERNRRAARREVRKFISGIHQAIHIPAAEERAARRMAVAPARALAAGAEMTSPAELPVEIVDAAEAARHMSDYSFTAESEKVDILALDQEAYRDDDLDDEFKFFREG